MSTIAAISTAPGRCGDPEAGVQEKDIAAVLDASATPPAPADPPDITDAHSAGEGIDPTDIDGNSDFIIEGDHLQGVSVTMQYNNDGPWSDPATVPEASLSRADGKVTVAAAWIGNQFGENNWDLGEGDNVKITVTNSAGSDSVERTVVYGA